MKLEHLRQITETMKAFGLSFEQATKTFIIHSVVLDIRHKKQCLDLALVLAMQKDTSKKLVIWEYFKRV